MRYFISLLGKLLGCLSFRDIVRYAVWRMNGVVVVDVWWKIWRNFSRMAGLLGKQGYADRDLVCWSDLFPVVASLAGASIQSQFE